MGQQGNARKFDEAEGYKPDIVPKALRVLQGSAEGTDASGGAAGMAHPIVNAIQNVFIRTTELRRSAEWYAMALGLPVLEERLDGGALYWFRLACGTGIILDRNPDLPEDPIVQLAYPTEDIESAYAYMQRLDVQLLTGILRPNASLAFFSFADPDGNKIMVMQSDNTDEVLARLPDAESPIQNRLGGIFVHVTDMERAARFHSEVLGLPQSVPDNTIYELKMTRGPAVLLDGNHLVQGDRDGALFMLVTQDVEASRAYMAANGVQPFTDIERFDPIAFFTVKDPDGNVIMFCQDDSAAG